MMKQRTTTTVPVSFFPIRHVNCRPTVSINWNSLFIVSTSCRHLSIHHHHHHHLHGTVKQQERKTCLNSTNGVALMGLDSVILKQVDARNRHEELRRPWRSNGNETMKRSIKYWAKTEKCRARHKNNRARQKSVTTQPTTTNCRCC